MAPLLELQELPELPEHLELLELLEFLELFAECRRFVEAPGAPVALEPLAHQEFSVQPL